MDTFDEVDTEFRDVVNKGATSVLEPTTEPWGGSAPAILQTRKEILLISGRSADRLSDKALSYYLHKAELCCVISPYPFQNVRK